MMMIDLLIRKALENRFITLLLFLVVTVLGVIAIYQTPVDALPDLSENQVIVMTPWPGQNPQNIEDQITYPLTVSMQGLAGVRDVRGMSQMGVSMVTVIFSDETDFYFARDRVSERLSMVRASLPEGVTPVLGPDATGLGQIFMYTLESEEMSLTELRSLQDFTVSYALASVPGVAEVASVGGYVKTYQVILDPYKLQQYGLTIQGVMSTIKMSNNNVSGRVLDTGDEEIAVQGIGFFEGVEDLRYLMVGRREDASVLSLQDVGEVRVSGAFRRGLLADDEDEKVGGIVVMRYGENPLAVIEGVKKKLEELESSLPEGVRVVPFYDRTGLILDAIDTLKGVLIQELLITAVILGLFLWHFGSTLITSIALLVGVIMTFLFMNLFGIPSNIMSLGGISVAIGTMVDSAIVISENAYRKLMRFPGVDPLKRLRLILQATLEVGKPIVFAIGIIILSFIPIFALEGMEGKLFKPLAFTNAFAMLGALIASLFLVPILSTFFLRGKLRKDEEIPLVRWLQVKYKRFLQYVLLARKKTLSIAGALVVVGAVLMNGIGSEFMPPLDEGSIMYMPITVPDVSERRILQILKETNRILSTIPEVKQVVGKAGRAQTATDPAPLSMIETFVTLKPKSQWRSGMTKKGIIREMNRKIQIDQLWNGFTQPIIGRVDMLSTGIRAEVGVKIFGDDPARLEELALEAEELLEKVPGASGVSTIRAMGLRYLDIDLDDELLAQHGIAKMDVLQVISAGIGGHPVAMTIEGRERYAVEVRLKQGYRQDVEDVKSLPLMGRHGTEVLLMNVADIQLRDGPAVIASENGLIRSAIQMNVSGRDLVSFVEDGQQMLEQQLKLPTGYTLEWAGQYENQQRAKERLSWIVPAVLLLIFFLLYLSYGDLGLVSVVLVTIPLSLVGGVIALYFAGYNFSVAVWVGFIALFGNAVETGMVIVVYLENAFRTRFGLPLIEGEKDDEDLYDKPQVVTREGIHEAVMEGALLRLRPILMTAFTSTIGLIPMLVTTGTGAEVQKPLALVIVFGLTSSVFMTLIVLPILFSLLRERKVGKIAS